MCHNKKNNVGSVVDLRNMIEHGRLRFDSNYNSSRTTKISITGQDGSGKTTLRNSLADSLANNGFSVIIGKSPCDKHVVDLLNNAISQYGYEDWYTEQLLFSFMDGVLSNYMRQMTGKYDYFICQRGPIGQYAHGVTRSGKSFSVIHDIQKPERLEKFDAYIHLNCEPWVAWERLADDPNKDRYETFEYFQRQSPNTRILYEKIIHSNEPELDFLRSSAHLYIDTTLLSTEEVRKISFEWLKQLNLI